MAGMREVWFGENDTNPSLRDLVRREENIETPRTVYEDRVGARLPGDALEGHDLYTPPNPYITMKREALWDMLGNPNLDPEERAHITRALQYQQLQHSDGVMPGRGGDASDPGGLG